MSFCLEKTKVRYQSSQEILKIKVYSDQSDWLRVYSGMPIKKKKKTGSAFLDACLSLKPKSDIEPAKRY